MLWEYLQSQMSLPPCMDVVCHEIIIVLLINLPWPKLWNRCTNNPIILLLCNSSNSLLIKATTETPETYLIKRQKAQLGRISGWHWHLLVAAPVLYRMDQIVIICNQMEVTSWIYNSMRDNLIIKRKMKNNTSWDTKIRKSRIWQAQCWISTRMMLATIMKRPTQKCPSKIIWPQLTIGIIKWWRWLVPN